MLTHSFVNSTIPDKIVKVQLREVIDKARRRKDDQRAAIASNRSVGAPSNGGSNQPPPQQVKKPESGYTLQKSVSRANYERG